MEATSQNQLLDTQALCNKLSQAITPGNRVLNAGDIKSTWGNSVYLVGNLTGSRIPNNGEICPVRTYSYGNTLVNAYSGGSSTTINVRDLNWDSDYTFDMEDISNMYFYNGESAAASGYYMDIPSNPSQGCPYFQVGSAGKVSNMGYFRPHYFTWNSTGEDGWATIQLGNSTAFSSNENTFTMLNTYKGAVDGTVDTDSNTIATISTTSSGGSVSVRKSSADNNYPFSFAVFYGRHNDYGTQNFYHGVMATPATSFWTLSANDLNVPFTSDDNKAASIVTNMGESNYSLSKAGSENWISINPDGKTLSISMNPNYFARSATINVSSQFTTEFSVYNNLDGIEYTSPSKSTSFTVTQASYPATVYLYVLVFKKSPEIMCISAASDSYVRVAGGAPVRISVTGMKIQTDPTIGATIYTGGGQINTGEDTGLVRWFPILPNGSYIASINDYGTVSATNLPGYYTLDTQVHFLNGTFNG